MSLIPGKRTFFLKYRNSVTLNQNNFHRRINNTPNSANGS